MKTYPESILRTLPSIPVFLGILAFGVGALELATSVVTRAGFSIQPAAYLAAIGFVVAPSVFRQRRETRRSESESESFRPVSRVITPDPVEVALRTVAPSREVLDARVVFPEFLYHAVEAQLALLPTGESLLAARFASPQAAKEAAEGYRTFFGMSGPQGRSDTSWRGARTLAHDVADVRCTGTSLVAWAARNHSQLDARLVATGGIPRFHS